MIFALVGRIPVILMLLRNVRLSFLYLMILNYLTQHSLEFFWFLQSLFPLLIAPHLATNLFDLLAVLTPSLSLSLLMFSSTIFTESISTPKYPAYTAAYKKRVAMFWPTDTLRKIVWLRVTKGTAKKGEIERAIWGVGSDVGVDGARAIEAKEE